MKGKQMPDANYRPGGSHDRPGELDDLLDAALSKYAAVEPPAGLEGRVLAHLRVGPLRPPLRGWLHWGFAGAVALIVVVAVLAWISTRRPHFPSAHHPPATIPQPSTQQTKPALQATDDVAAVKPASMWKPVARRAPVSTAVAAYPKLDQFPSPQPLTAEEIALALYVKNFPKDARLVAQTQEEFELEAQKEMTEGSETWSSGSTQHER